MVNSPITKGQRTSTFKEGKNTNEQYPQGQTSNHKDKDKNKKKRKRELSKSLIETEIS